MIEWYWLILTFFAGLVAGIFVVSALVVGTTEREGVTPQERVA